MMLQQLPLVVDAKESEEIEDAVDALEAVDAKADDLVKADDESYKKLNYFLENEKCKIK